MEINKKKVHIITFGCQMNVHDSDKMVMLLSKHNYEWTDDPKDADLIILNTCSVREGPERKVHSTLGRFKPLKKIKKDLILGVAGCVAQQKKDTLFKEIPYLDIVIGTDQIEKLPTLLDQLSNKQGDKNYSTDFQNRENYKFLTLDTGYEPSSVSEFVTISIGCNKFCSYCIVPYVRGGEVSRDFNTIIDDIKQLSKKGVKEITLLGQTVNSYITKDKTKDFSDLLVEISKIENIKRIRFTSPHPKYFNDKLIKTMASLDKVVNHVHLPLQSGSTNVLKHMHRQYSGEKYFDIVTKLKEYIPNIEITTDIIVGYPTETDQDFQETIEMVKKVKFDNIFSFVYSKRPGTKIYNIEETLTIQEKKERLYQLQKLQEEISRTKSKNLIGTVQEVLLDKDKDGRERDQFSGRTKGNRKVFIDDIKNHKIGDIISVKIVSATVNSLKGVL